MKNVHIVRLIVIIVGYTETIQLSNTQGTSDFTSLAKSSCGIWILIVSLVGIMSILIEAALFVSWFQETQRTEKSPSEGPEKTGSARQGSEGRGNQQPYTA